MPSVQVVDAVIANGASLSGAVNLQGRKLVGILMPSSWTAADLTFQAGDGSTYANVKDDQATPAEIVVGAEADAYIALIPSTEFEWANWIKVRSGTSGTPVNQGGARTLKLIVRDN